MYLLVLSLALHAYADSPAGEGPSEGDAQETAAPGESVEPAAEAPAVPIEPAVPDEDGNPSGDSAADFQTALQSAKQTYFQGGHHEALEALEALRERLLSGEDVPWPVGVEAMLYLGEIQLKLGDETAAWATFEWVLRRDPEQTMSPAHHPADAVLWFSQVQKYIEQTTKDAPPDPPLPPPPLPPWGYAPFGVPQIGQGQTAAGVTYGLLQLGLLTTSIAVYADIARLNREDNPAGLPDEDLVRRIQRERYLLQWPATFGFYGLWVASHFHARVTWRDRAAVSATVLLQPDPYRPRVFLSGRF